MQVASSVQGSCPGAGTAPRVNLTGHGSGARSSWWLKSKMGFKKLRRCRHPSDRLRALTSPQPSSLQARHLAERDCKQWGFGQHPVLLHTHSLDHDWLDSSDFEGLGPLGCTGIFTQHSEPAHPIHWQHVCTPAPLCSLPLWKLLGQQEDASRFWVSASV